MMLLATFREKKKSDVNHFRMVEEYSIACCNIGCWRHPTVRFVRRCLCAHAPAHTNELPPERRGDLPSVCSHKCYSKLSSSLVSDKMAMIIFHLVSLSTFSFFFFFKSEEPVPVNFDAGKKGKKIHMKAKMEKNR